jgi:hypothetical protein
MSTESVEQQRSSAGRVERIPVSDGLYRQLLGGPADPPSHNAAPSSTTDPDIVTSPLRADGLAPCTGLMFMIGVGDTPFTPVNPAGFVVTVWIRNPITRTWGDSTPIQVPVNRWVKTFDFNGGDLYFQFAPADFTPRVGLGAAGVSYQVDVHLVEL